MYINLILGILVLCAIIWLLVIYNRKDETPGEMLSDELARRRATQEAARRTREQLALVRDSRLEQVARALGDMRLTLVEEGYKPEQVRWNIRDGRLFLSVFGSQALEGEPAGPAGPSGAEAELSESCPAVCFDSRAEQFIIRWDLSNIDIDLPADLERLQSAAGNYILVWPDGSTTYSPDLPAFMRQVSAVIADKVA